MSPSTQRAITLIAIVGIASAWAYNSWVLKPAKQRQSYSERKAEDQRRFKEWAYVAKEKDVAPGETVKLIVIPSPYGVDLLDIKCLIYTNREFKNSSMVCPDADRNNPQESAE